MQLNEERIEMIQATLILEDSNYIFRTQGGDEYGVWDKHISFFPKGSDNCEMSNVEEVCGKDLTALIFLGWENGKEINREIEDWEEFARHVGIAKLQILATKVPIVIKTRFEFFANETNNPSAVLRSLVYEYVKRKMVENMDRLILREKI